MGETATYVVLSTARSDYYGNAIHGYTCMNMHPTALDDLSLRSRSAVRLLALARCACARDKHARTQHNPIRPAAPALPVPNPIHPATRRLGLWQANQLDPSKPDRQPPPSVSLHAFPPATERTGIGPTSAASPSAAASLYKAARARSGGATFLPCPVEPAEQANATQRKPSEPRRLVARALPVCPLLRPIARVVRRSESPSPPEGWRSPRRRRRRRRGGRRGWARTRSARPSGRAASQR